MRSCRRARLNRPLESEPKICCVLMLFNFYYVFFCGLSFFFFSGLSMERSPPPAPKRLKPSSPDGSSSALRFALSPQSINVPEAIALKQNYPNLCLRLTSLEDLPPEKASLENIRPGYGISVWPSQTGQTNKVYSEFLHLRDEYLLYCHLLQTSFVTCIGDAISFVLAMLDHCLRGQVKSLQKDFIGPYTKKPFESEKAEHITYLILLKFIGYLQKQLEQEGKQKQLEQEASDEVDTQAELWANCVTLLESTEASLINLLEKLGAEVKNHEAFASALRNDIIAYRNLRNLFAVSTAVIDEESKDLIDRNLGSHPFTLLLWTQYKTPLAQLQGLEEEFPKPHIKLFKDEVLGKVALLLQDVEKKFKEGATGEKYEMVLPTAFFLIREFIKRNNKHERAVQWYRMEATIPGQKNPIHPPLVIGGKSSLVAGGSTSKTCIAVFPSSSN